MTEKRISEKNLQKKTKLGDDNALSHNFSKSVKYRLRVQQDKEKEKEVEEYLTHGEVTQRYD